MPRLTVTNLTNSPFDLEGGFRLPAMGRVTEEFSEGYAGLLRASPGVEVAEAEEPAAPPPAVERKGAAPRRSK